LQAASNSETMTDMHYVKRVDPVTRLAVLFAILLATIQPVAAQTTQLEDLDSFPRGKLEIGLNAKKRLKFEIWLADTPARQSQGLMFVRSLPALRGMLFVHESPRPVGMWMKNTFIPLDMLFIDAKGRIQQIVENTTPHSLDVIRSNLPALAVLEIAGGEARRLGIKPGQRVSHPALGVH
jgi:uncharacterized membrane protein (UPF0127 family)